MKKGLGIIIVLVVGLFILIGGSVFFFFQKKEEIGQEIGRKTITEIEKSKTGGYAFSDTPSKNINECFANYREEFMPQKIGNYQLTEIFDKTPSPKDKFQPKGPQHMQMKVNWGLTGKYLDSEKKQIIFSIESPDKNDYEYQKLTQYLDITNDNVMGMPIRIGTKDSLNRSDTIAHIPNQPVLIDMEFIPDQGNSKEIFTNWLKLACSF